MSQTDSRIKFLFKFALLTFYAHLRGIRFIVFCHTRTAEEQNQRFKEGKSLCDGYKKISKHQQDRAKDLVILDKDNQPEWDHNPEKEIGLEYDILGNFWTKVCKGVWGGTWYKEGKTKFDDCYHFEI